MAITVLNWAVFKRFIRGYTSVNKGADRSALMHTKIDLLRSVMEIGSVYTFHSPDQQQLAIEGLAPGLAFQK